MGLYLVLYNVLNLWLVLHLAKELKSQLFWEVPNIDEMTEVTTSLLITGRAKKRVDIELPAG